MRVDSNLKKIFADLVNAITDEMIEVAKCTAVEFGEKLDNEVEKLKLKSLRRKNHDAKRKNYS